jgi:hypothetical protein
MARSQKTRFSVITVTFAIGLIVLSVGLTNAQERAGFAMPLDWTSRRILHSRNLNSELVRAARSERRVLYNWFRDSSEALRLSAQNFLRTGKPRFRQRVDWNFPLGAGTVARNMSPAKFSFDINTADCANDYVTYLLNIAGSNTQPNIVRMNNIYAGTGGLCGTSPTLESAYQVNTLDLTGLLRLNGQMLTSPSMSLDGTKIAFIETVTSSALICPGLAIPSTCSIFHVLTWGTSGNNGSYDNTTGAYTAVPPGGGAPANNATINTLTYSSATNTYSSPWVDYDSGDHAYFGDDNGRIYRTTCTFQCANGVSPQISAGWPIAVASAGVKLSGAVHDSSTNKIFAGGSDGKLYMVPLATCPGAGCIIGSVSVGSSDTFGGIKDGPLLDSTFQTVFAFAGDDGTGAGVMFQTNESLNLGPNISATMGSSPSFDILDGAPDDAYFNNDIGGAAVSGHLFSCGVSGGSGSPSLYWSTFTKNAGNLSLSNPPRLNTSLTKVSIPGNSGTGCSPLTEFKNGATDRLFFSQSSVPANNCVSGSPADGCVFMYDITNIGGIGNTPSAAAREHSGSSAIIIDNASGSPQASSIYLANEARATDPCWTGPAASKVSSYCAFKLTQSALQ